MDFRRLVSLGGTICLTWVASYIFAMACAAFAIIAFYSDEVPTVDDVALFAVVGVAAFSVPMSLFMTLCILTCATTCDDVIHFWIFSMILTSSLAPAVGGAILDAPNVDTAALLNGCIVALVVVVALIFVMPLAFGLYMWCRQRTFPEQRTNPADQATPTDISENIEASEPASSQRHVTHVPYIVIDHPGGELHVGRPDDPPSIKYDGGVYTHYSPAP